MKAKRTKSTMAALILIMCLILLTPTALATGVASGEIPVKVSLGGSPPAVDEDYKIIMKTDNLAYPMPAESVGGIFSMIVQGENSAKLPQIEFSSLGIYTYTIFQETGTNKLATYDSKEYDLVVYVTNAETGSGLETTYILYPQGNKTDKIDKVSFHNEYKAKELPKTPEVKPPTGELPKTGMSPMTPVVMFLGIILVVSGFVELFKKEDKKQLR